MALYMAGIHAVFKAANTPCLKFQKAITGPSTGATASKAHHAALATPVSKLLKHWGPRALRRSRGLQEGKFGPIPQLPRQLHV